MKIVSRAEWGAKPPKSRYTIAPTGRLWLHHFGSEHHGAAGMRQIQAFHMGPERGWSDFAYSFAVDNADGTIYEGRGALVAGGHTKGDNSKSHAIVIMGNTHSREVSPAAQRSIAWLTRHGRERGWWTTPKITGTHRDAQRMGFSPYNGTVCAGDFAQRVLADINDLAVGGPAPAPSPEENDLYGTDIICSYGEAGYPLDNADIWSDIRRWTHEIYNKPEAERRGGVQFIRLLLGLPKD